MIVQKNRFSLLVLSLLAATVSFAGGLEQGFFRIWKENGEKHRIPVRAERQSDGETLATVTATDGLQTLRVVPTGREDTIVFRYMPGADNMGAAVLYGMKNLLGFQIVIR